MTSADDQLGRILASARRLAGISRQSMAKRMRYSASHIGNVESGLRHVTADIVHAYALALGVSLLAGIWEVDAMQRRALMAALSRAGAIGLTGPAALAEAIRIALLDRYAPTDWPERAALLGEQFMTAPAAVMHDTIGVHLLALLGEETVTPQMRDIAARLMLLRAMTTANLGNAHDATGWYQAALKTAKDTGDKRLITWVYGRHATRLVYENPNSVGVLKTTAEIDCAEAHLARAHAFARLGLPGAAMDELDDARRTYQTTTKSEGTVFAFQPWRFQLAEAGVWAQLGDVNQTERQIACISIPHPMARFQAQQGLTLAMAMARASDRESAMIQRDNVLRDHPQEQTSIILTTMTREISR